jgi:hypothetical protein
MSAPESIPPASNILKVGHWHHKNPELLTGDTYESALHAQFFKE